MRRRSPGTTQDRLFHHAPAAALEPLLPLDLGVGLAHRDRHEDLPEVLAIGELGELALGDPRAEAVERGERGVFLVSLDSRLPLLDKLGPGQDDQLAEIALPERLGRGQIAPSQVSQPVRDGAPLSVHHPSLRPGVVLQAPWRIDS